MRKVPVNIKKLKANAALPVYSSAAAAGADLRACLEEDVIIRPGKTEMISTGFAMEVPEGYAGLIYARIGLASKRGLAPANKVGVIDSDYRGEIMVALHNHSEEAAVISHGERIAQLIITPYLTAEFTEKEVLEETERGFGGFGSTGIK